MAAPGVGERERESREYRNKRTEFRTSETSWLTSEWRVRREYIIFAPEGWTIRSDLILLQFPDAHESAILFRKCRPVPVFLSFDNEKPDIVNGAKRFTASHPIALNVKCNGIVGREGVN